MGVAGQSKPGRPQKGAPGALGAEGDNFRVDAPAQGLGEEGPCCHPDALWPRAPCWGTRSQAHRMASIMHTGIAGAAGANGGDVAKLD